MESEVNWKEYVREVAEEYGVPFSTAWAIFDLLGPSEAYDGFICELQDFEMLYGGDRGEGGTGL